MTDPYQVLGVSPSATDEQIKNAYRELARKYHPDNYVNNPLADLAQEKMKEINEAYDQIQRQRKQQQQSYSGQNSANRGYSNSGYSRQSYSGQGRSQFADIRQLLNSNRLSEAEELLEGIPQQRRDAEWYYLRGRVFYVHGWLDQAYSYYTRAVQMNPGNAEYQTALNQLMWQRNTGRPSGGYGDYRNVQSGGMSGCDMCSGLICADCCCECMGGDLISCC
ncbi:MAG: DnaJ domain-containing protein [Negativibacillus sp.]|nr:DnaJ domain-containing protein [Negativibacillus sp.]